MPLTDTFVKQARYSGKPAGEKYSDGGGLYLHITAPGKYWRLAYRYAGKQKTLALGVYPAITLAKARKRRDEAKAQLAEGLDPGQVKKAQKFAKIAEGENSFEAVARELHATKSKAWSERYASKWLRYLTKELFPYIGNMPISEVTAPIVLSVLRKIEKREVQDTAHTVRQIAGQVFRYGVQTGRCERNPIPDLQGALEPKVVKHMAAVLEPAQAGELMRSFDGYQGQLTTKAALRLSALIFQRPVNVRTLEWNWISFENAMITIPSMNMKRTKAQKINGRPHLVPLARQAIDVLMGLKALTGRGKYVFPSLLTGERPMSNNTVNTALRRLGYTNDEMTAHGFRAMARTLLIERLPGIEADVIEAQLAHVKSGPLGAAYDRAEYIDQRRQLMQTWADYLDRLKSESVVTPG
ncbi:MAG: integrase arm-type DNA-binding domain-containing protein [Comamonas sp.]|jgi:integrase|uniref:tyrosine-type recombinase/integrase n=1 Tax=Comamonas sp. TaxID=34028 RepID=UPI002842A8D1|nr:integrase arm-type DNA-binding domain-containing protein [Comamonas sp.]MDR3066261.1 integrase arm-type DNA-binding domain-containing protein [Comamonas sp.]